MPHCRHLTQPHQWKRPLGPWFCMERWQSSSCCRNHDPSPGPISSLPFSRGAPDFSRQLPFGLCGLSQFLCLAPEDPHLMEVNSGLSVMHSLQEQTFLQLLRCAPAADSTVVSSAHGLQLSETVPSWHLLAVGTVINCRLEDKGLLSSYQPHYTNHLKFTSMLKGSLASYDSST